MEGVRTGDRSSTRVHAGDGSPRAACPPKPNNGGLKPLERLQATCRGASVMAVLKLSVDLEDSRKQSR